MRFQILQRVLDASSCNKLYIVKQRLLTGKLLFSVTFDAPSGLSLLFISDRKMSSRECHGMVPFREWAPRERNVQHKGISSYSSFVTSVREEWPE